ncbi:MAG: hypothetical protein ACRDVC_11670 [Acidimicrobiales bacterium]
MPISTSGNLDMDTATTSCRCWINSGTNMDSLVLVTHATTITERAQRVGVMRESQLFLRPEVVVAPPDCCGHMLDDAQGSQHRARTPDYSVTGRAKPLVSG